MDLLSIVFQLARRCERVLINKYLDVFYSEFVTLLHDDREEGKQLLSDVGRIFAFTELCTCTCTFIFLQTCQGCFCWYLEYPKVWKN